MVRNVLVATLLAATLLMATPPAGAAPAPALDDSFFVPPDPLPAGAPGDIIRWRPSRSGPLRNPANAWQIMYLSTNALGQPDAVTATVLVPRNVDPTTAPIVSSPPASRARRSSAARRTCSPATPSTSSPPSTTC